MLAQRGNEASMGFEQRWLGLVVAFQLGERLLLQVQERTGLAAPIRQGPSGSRNRRELTHVAALQAENRRDFLTQPCRFSYKLID